ncbi:alpha-tocopherol transfer protein-like isoform X1 [Diorhabda sublineata]|uniref:alpha-tocopherol transfer protein-like isoform X1 n=1 Tax=Diorhabda sublineata TaxID=1163346 RepID=UPI0024E0FC9E|nr:alpha-tocopherol transfer protein-like isoform X1 [Diorhabda sublineata]
MSYKEINVEELYNKDDKLKKEDVKGLMEWLEKQPHLPNVSELQVAIFLHSCYYGIEATKNTIDTYFTVKTICGDIFGSKNPKSDAALQLALNTLLVYPLPKLTDTGDLVVLCSLIDTNPDNYVVASQFNLFDLATVMHTLQNGPPQGVHIVVDMKGIVFAHFLKLNPIVIKKFLYYLQEGMPIRLKSLHFINIVSFMDKILALIKPFMKKELIDSLYLHTNTESIFKQIPKDVFPQEYGGSCESIKILQEKTKCQMNDNAKLIVFLTNQVVDESKRHGKPKNANEIFGVEGSFKKLQVD